MTGDSPAAATLSRWLSIAGAVVSLFPTACTSGSGGPAPARITVDTTTHFQIMTGWEATAQAGHENREYSHYRDTLLALAAGDLGINRVRLEVRSGVEHTRDYWAEGKAGRLSGDAFRCGRYETLNDNVDPRVISWSGFHFAELDHTVESLVLPLRDAIVSRGQHMVLEVTYVSFFGQCPRGRRYDHRDPQEYAEMVLATSIHLREKYGLTPDLWEVILEADNTPDWNGLAVGRAIAAAAPRLREQGFTFKFVAPSDKNMARSVVDYDALRAVPGAVGELAELSYHRYRGVSHNALRALAERGRRDNVRTAMLEHIGSGIDDLIEDLTVGQVSAWSQFALAYPDADDGGLYYIVDTTDRARSTVREGSRTRFLRQVFRYVRLGAVRLGAESDGKHARAVAFRNSDGGVAVAIRTTRATALAVDGLGAGRYGITYATDSDPRHSLPDTTLGVANTLHAVIPEAGVLTVFTRRAP